MEADRRHQITKAAIQTTEVALADERLSDDEKLLYLDVVARYANGYGWLVGNADWDPCHLRKLAYCGYLRLNDDASAVAVVAIDNVLFDGGR